MAGTENTLDFMGRHKTLKHMLEEMPRGLLHMASAEMASAPEETLRGPLPDAGAENTLDFAGV